MSARRDEHAAVARDGGGIVCALETGETSARTLAHAVALARITGGGLTLVHVLENMSQYQAAALCARVDWPAFCRQVEQDARERVWRTAEAAGCGSLVADVVVTTGKPYREILRLAEVRDAAAIVMGIHGRATLELANPAQKRMIDEVEVGRQVAPKLRVAFEVDDTRAVTEELVAAGATPVAPPTETPWRSLNARLDAPGGLHITIFQELESEP